MFQSLFFFLIALLTLESSFPWVKSSYSFVEKAEIVILTFACLLALFLLQRKFFFKKISSKKLPLRLQLLGMVELLGWLFFVQNGLNIQEGVSAWSILIEKACLLSLYLIAVCFLQLTLLPDFSFKKFSHSLKGYAFLFLLPFALTYLFFELFQLIISPLSHTSQTDIAALFDILLTMIFALFMLSMMAPITVKIWGCKPIKSSELKARLEARCRDVGFHHRGLMIWTLMNHSVTAAIFGFLPGLRYILFTQPLLEQFTTEEVESVLLHELGHYHYKHLLLYPLLSLGAGVSLSLLFAYSEPLIQKIGESLGFTLFFAISISFIFFYFRYIFGFFSRRFERAADLFPLKRGMDPRHLISALNKISHLTHTPLKQPNWHHGSIKDRIETIERAWLLPSLVKKYELSTCLWLMFYALLFFTVTIFFLLKLFTNF